MAAVYETSPIKRQRSTKVEVEARKAAEESERAIIGRLVRIATSSTTGIGGEDAP